MAASPESADPPADLAPAPPADPAPPPTRQGQINFIISNGPTLDRDTQLTILNLVLMEAGPRVPDPATGAEQVVVYDSPVADCGSMVNLDAIDSPELILHIYNIMKAWRKSLDTPARDPLGGC